MAQSLNKTVFLTTTGTSYLSIAGLGNSLVGDQAFRIYPDVNVSASIYPDSLSHINQIGATHWVKTVATSKSLQTKENSFFASKDLRCHS